MMKYRFLLLLTGMIAATLAFSQNVTFRVDMRNENVANVVRLTGDFAGWYDGKLEMSDADHDDIHEISLRLLPGRYEYKFLNGNWSGTELLSSPSAKYCTISSNGNVNRILEVGQTDTILPVVCFDSCMACGVQQIPGDVNVTFEVDMAALGVGSTFVTGGSLDNWCGNCIGMTDANSDLVYTVTIPMAPGMHEFKFTRNGWSNGEILAAGSPCTVTNFNFTNRSLYVPLGAGAISMPVAPFNGCAPNPVNMYLEVDLGSVQADPAGVFVAGNFNNWSATSTPMENLGHGIWGRNIVAKAGDSLIYQFFNGPDAELVPLVCANAAGKRWQIVPVEMPRMPAVCIGQCGPCADALNLVWADEFNGTGIDPSKWNYEVGNGVGGWGNNELQFYTASPNNARINNGSLEITARQENLSGFAYTSARMTTRMKGDHTYGRIEARIMSPQGKGIWPAFWMLPTDQVYGGWPSSGEIDVFELIGSEPDRLHGTIHYGPAPGAGHFSDGDYWDLPGSMDYADGFHIFAVEWEPNEIRWYMDSVLYHSVSPWEISPCDWPFDQDMHILLNVAVGGYWPGNPDASTVFPQTMAVDYVRVYGSGPVSRPEQAAVSGIGISPNPSNGSFQVDLGDVPKAPLLAEVRDLNGRIVLARELKTRITLLELDHEPAGIYFLKVASDKGLMVKKLVLVD